VVCIVADERELKKMAEKFGMPSAVLPDSGTGTAARAAEYRVRDDRRACKFCVFHAEDDHLREILGIFAKVISKANEHLRGARMITYGRFPRFLRR